MQARLDWYKISGGAYQAMAGLEGFVRSTGLDPALLHLMKMRVSQINGCAYCLDMHSKDARAAGETEQRLYELNAWRETPFYSARAGAGVGGGRRARARPERYSWSAIRRTVTRRFFTSGMPAVEIGPRLAAWMRASWMPLSMRKRRTASTRRWLRP